MWERGGETAQIEVRTIRSGQKQQIGGSRNNLCRFFQKLFGIRTQYFGGLKIVLKRNFLAILSKMTYFEIGRFGSDPSKNQWFVFDFTSLEFLTGFSTAIWTES